EVRDPTEGPIDEHAEIRYNTLRPSGEEHQPMRHRSLWIHPHAPGFPADAVTWPRAASRAYRHRHLGPGARGGRAARPGAPRVDAHGWGWHARAEPYVASGRVAP